MLTSCHRQPRPYWRVRKLRRQPGQPCANILAQIQSIATQNLIFLIFLFFQPKISRPAIKRLGRQHLWYHQIVAIGPNPADTYRGGLPPRALERLDVGEIRALLDDEMVAREHLSVVVADICHPILYSVLLVGNASGLQKDHTQGADRSAGWPS